MFDELKNLNNYIFDMDGTLINSSKEVLQCLKNACNKNKAQINLNNFSPDVIGPPLKDIIKAIIFDNGNEELVNNINDEYRLLYDNNENDKSCMYENTYEWLISLKNSGKRLFLATNKPTIPTLRLIKKFNLNMFEDFYTIDKYLEKEISKKEMLSEIIEKYNLEKMETIMIGDAPSDIKAAHFAGIKAIGVLWGYGNHKTILKEIADYTIEPCDLKSLLKIR